MMPPPPPAIQFIVSLWCHWSVPQPVINSDATTELIYFPQSLISLAISFLCRVKENCALKYHSLSLAATMRCLQKSENCEDCDTFRWNSAGTSPNLTIRMGRKPETTDPKQKKSSSPGIDCFTLITLDFYDFYASTFLSCNENDFRQWFQTNKRKTLVISLSAHVITALVQRSVRRSVSEAVINVQAQVARRIKNILLRKCHWHVNRKHGTWKGTS